MIEAVERREKAIAGTKEDGDARVRFSAGENRRRVRKG